VVKEDNMKESGTRYLMIIECRMYFM